MAHHRRVRLCVHVINRRHRHRPRLVPVRRREGQGRRAHRHVRVAAHRRRHRHRPRRLGLQHDRVGRIASLRNRQRGRGHLHPTGVVVGNRHRRPGHVQARDDRRAGHRQRLVLLVEVVVHGRQRERRRAAGQIRIDRQRELPDRHVVRPLRRSIRRRPHRYRHGRRRRTPRLVQRPRHRHRGRTGALLHLLNRHRQLDHRRRRVVVVDRYHHIVRQHRPVVRPRDLMAHNQRVRIRVHVMIRPHHYRAHLIPVRRREAQRNHRAAALRMPRPHCHRPRRLGLQHDRVGLISSLPNRQRGRGHMYPTDIVVANCHGGDP